MVSVITVENGGGLKLDGIIVTHGTGDSGGGTCSPIWYTNYG